MQTPYDPESDPEFADVLRDVRSRIDEHRALDSLIREMARDRVTARALERELTQIRRELVGVRAFHDARDVMLPALGPAYEGRRSARIDAGMPLSPMLGLHSMERDGSGRPFRWTGPGRDFRFDVHLDRTVGVKFVLRLAFASDTRVGTIRAHSDGIEIPLTRVTKARITELGGVLFPRTVLGLTRLEFSVDQTFRPQPAERATADERELGVAFREIEFIEASEAEMAALMALPAGDA